jgi:glycosyltransferase involved in cell wall biosynthesis
MDVSFVIPAYQCRPFLREAVESALRQDPPPREVIVVDDGSTDRPEEALAGLDPGRLRFLRQENRGPAGARNAGVARAEGEAVAFLDGDDVALPGRVRASLDVLERRPEVGLVFGQVLVFRDGERPESGKLDPWAPAGDVDFARLVRGNVVPTSAATARRDLITRAGGFDERASLRGAEDYHLWMRLSRIARVVGLDRPLSAYRDHAGSLVGGGHDRNFDRGVAALHALLAEDAAAADAAGGRRAALVRYCVRRGGGALRRGDLIGAAQALAMVARFGIL